ncbi:MAG: hypothetical protein E7013_02840 [Alphaproteobacteria bacterium]|nr:hypothetical protein [Alphaproteobacteria bacterium]
MKIKCENCSVEYEVPDARLSLEHPHFFKCSACGFVFDFKQKQEDDDVMLPPSVEQSDVVPMPLSEIFDEKLENNEEIQEEQKINIFSEEQKFEENHPSPLFTSWDETDEFMPISKTQSKTYKKMLIFFVVFILCFCAVLFLIYEGRYLFSRKFDWAHDIYQKTGISTDITADGLAFQNTIFDSLSEREGYVLLIKSQVVNTTDAEKKLAVVLIHILDEQDNVIQTKEVDLGKDALFSGEKIYFEERLFPVTDKAKRIELTFKKEE